MATQAIQRIRPFEGMSSKTITGRVTGTVYIANPLGYVVIDTRDASYLLADGWVSTPWFESASSSNSGSTTINFGAFPGSSHTTTTIASVDAGDPNAILDAWVTPIATADHSADEHVIDGPRVEAYADGNGNVIIAGCANVPNLTDRINPGPDPMPYGLWNVGWAFAV